MIPPIPKTRHNGELLTLLNLPPAMTSSITTSTLFLTVLMMIGLFFFIRASIKERIEQIELEASQSTEQLFLAMQTYFEGRAYQLITVDDETGQATFEGFVRPSVFLAVLLSGLAGIGLVCLGFVLSYLVPAVGDFGVAIALLCPLAGVFYWKRAARVEQVLLKVEAGDKNRVKVRGHRDELAELQRQFATVVQS